jgi:hypothetical protein
VKCFFFFSGFLVTQSWLARRHLVPFAAARALRKRARFASARVDFARRMRAGGAADSGRG